MSEILESYTYEYLDQDATEAITELMDGDAEMVIDLVETLEETSAELLEELSVGVRTGDLVRVKESAHALKSSNAQLGAINFSALCQEVEHMAKRGDSQDLPSLLTQIQEEHLRVAQALKSWKDILNS